MLERVYDTIRGILYDSMPKDFNGKVVVYDRPVTAWYIGERDVKNSNLSITIKGGQSSLKDIGLGLQEISYSLKIEVDAGADNIELSERLVQETTRIILAVMRRHRRIWVMEICPICNKFILSPEHFLIQHLTILQPYVNSTVTDYENIWSQTHPESIPPATLPNSTKGAESFLRMCEDVRNNIAVANLPNDALKNIQKLQSEFVEPVRILYDVICTDNTFSDDATNKALQKGGVISISAKELLKQQFYGPDNVSTTAVKYI